MNIQTIELNVTGAAMIPLNSLLSWKGTTSVLALLKGWSKLQVAFSNFLIVETNLGIVTNISSGWILYQVVLFKTIDWALSTGTTSQIIAKMPSQIFGLVTAQLNIASIDCSGDNCSAIMNGSSFGILGSNETDVPYAQKS